MPFICREWAQAAPDKPVRVEVVFELELPNGKKITSAVPVDPIEDTSIGDGSGSWNSDDLKARLEDILGDVVEFPIDPPAPTPSTDDTSNKGVQPGLEV